VSAGVGTAELWTHICKSDGQRPRRTRQRGWTERRAVAQTMQGQIYGGAETAGGYGIDRAALLWALCRGRNAARRQAAVQGI
jgi:hypothetical protein